VHQVTHRAASLLKISLRAAIFSAFMPEVSGASTEPEQSITAFDASSPVAVAQAVAYSAGKKSPSVKGALGPYITAH
jgi:hypothetical protein